MSETPDQPMALDYDRLASTYDQRYETSIPQGIADRIDSLASLTASGGWLEVGCGTGQWLGRLPRTQLAFGVDRSMGMLRVGANTAPLASLVQADAQLTPFEAAAMSSIVCINALHHLGQPAAFITECRRLLRDGGQLLIVGLDPHDASSQWPAYDYFDGVREDDFARYPTFSTLDGWLEATSFRVSEAGVAETIDREQDGAALLADPFMSAVGTSQLARLSPAAYEAGIAKIRTEIARSPGMIFRTHLQLRFRLARLELGSRSRE